MLYATRLGFIGVVPHKRDVCAMWIPNTLRYSIDSLAMKIDKNGLGVDVDWIPWIDLKWLFSRAKESTKGSYRSDSLVYNIIFPMKNR